MSKHWARSLLTPHQDTEWWVLHDTAMFYSFWDHLQHNIAYFMVMFLSEFGWSCKRWAAQSIHCKCISLPSPVNHCPATGGSVLLLMLRSLCLLQFTSLKGSLSGSSIWLNSLSFLSVAYASLVHLISALPWGLHRFIPFCVAILFFCSIILIPVAAPVTPYPVFSSLFFLSSLCTVSQANHFTLDSSPGVAFSFHHLQISSQDEILSIWLQI